MGDYPNIAWLAQADPATLTSRQLQVHVIRQDCEKPARGSMHQADKDARMAAAVPALLAHIDELYGENERLRGEVTRCRRWLGSAIAERNEARSGRDSARHERDEATRKAASLERLHDERDAIERAQMFGDAR